MAERAAQPANNEGAKFVERIENVNKQIDDLKSEHMLKCKDLRDDISGILDDAKAKGFSKTSIKAVVKARKADRKAKEAYDELDPVDRNTFDAIRHSLGDYADLPLGKAAVDAATKNGANKAPAEASA